MGEILFGLGIVAFVVLWVVVARSNSRKTKHRVEVISRAGQILGFDYSETGAVNKPTIRGTYDQIEFEVKLQYADAESDSVYLEYEMVCALPAPDRKQHVLDLLDEWKRVKITSDSIVVDSRFPDESNDIVRNVERLALIATELAT